MYVYAANITVTCNFLYDNGDSTQVADEGTENVYVLNYYNDWTSPDANSDGLVDLPYELDGEPDNRDLFPLADPNTVPTIPEVTTTNGTGTGGQNVPLEVVLIVAGAAVVLLVGAIVLKRRG
jgi:hypothetical protein